MENLIWAIFLWLLVIIFIPYERIKNLRIVGLISLIWLFILEFTFIHLEYYRFIHYNIGIFGIPILYLLGGIAGGLLMIYWIKQSFYNKISVIIIFSLLLLFAEYLYVVRGAFLHINGWNFFYSFLLNLFGLSTLVWLCLLIAGKEKIYKNNYNSMK